VPPAAATHDHTQARVRVMASSPGPPEPRHYVDRKRNLQGTGR